MANDEKKKPTSDMHKFGYVLAASVGFGLGYLFFSKRAFAGGYADRNHFTFEDVPKRQLEIGTDVEMEHTRQRSIARRIALDHLAEDPEYYRNRLKLTSEDFQ